MKNRDEMQKELMARMQRGGTTGGFDLPMKAGTPILTLDNSTHTLDIIPYYAGAYDPLAKEGDFTYLLELFFHNNAGVSEGRRLCPQANYGKPCPICEDRRRLIQDGADDDAIKRTKVKQYSRTFYNVICYDSREQEAKGIQVLPTSYYLLEMYLRELAKRPFRPGSKDADPYTKFFDLKDGKSIMFKKEGKADQTKYIGIRFEDRDYELDEKLIDKAFCLDEQIIIPTYEDLQVWYYGSGEDAAAGMRSHRQAPADDTASYRRPKVQEDGGESPRREKEKEKEQNPCPEGYTFGDVDDHKECKKCPEPTWNECAKMHDQMRLGKEKEKVDEPPPPPPEEETTGRRRRGAPEEEQKKPEEETTGRRRRGEEEQKPEEEVTGRRRRNVEDDPPVEETTRRRRRE